MIKGKKICIVGAGAMGEAMVRGLLKAGAAAPEDITACDKREDQLERLHKTYGIQVSRDNLASVKTADLIFLSVKPQVLPKVLDQIAPAVDRNKLFVSIAAGVPVAAIEHKLGRGARIVRAMPNTPALVGMAATAISSGEHATDEDMALAKELFDSVGLTVEVEEPLIDAVTGLSGSGPAYVFLIIEALADAGVKVGLDRQTAQKLAAQAVFGSARLQIETGMHPGQLKDQVTSPGGTAIAGLHTLEAGGLRTTLIDAVEAATKRARELGADFLAETKNGKR
jgi:pyrroline-5-carboxylate reductase